MAGKIPKEAIDEIYRRADIVDVVSDYVALKKRGANYWGLSPFKQERTPSFSVSPSKGIYKCFSTGKGGNVVGFLMEIEGLSYPDALRLLARRYGIPLTETDNDESRAVRDKRESMFVLNKFAAQWFADRLSDEARQYFRKRGFSDETISEFGLGYCPEGWTTFTDAAIKAKFAPVLLLETGLSVKSEKTGKLYDRFRGRMMFPIHDVMGRVAGFAGRAPAAEPQIAKYVNSPESDAYHKGKLLYGLHLTKTHVRAKNECYLVEGYTDVISLYQAGVKNVCAGAGTALTVEQAALIKRFAHTVTVLYDGDSAGIHAALRGVDVLLAQGLHVYVLLLPSEHDPDSFVRQNGAQAFFDYAAQHRTDFITFKIRTLGARRLQDPSEKARVVREVAASVARIPDDLRRTMYVKPCADALWVDENVFLTAMREEGLRILREEKLLRERERRLGSGLPGLAASRPSSDPHFHSPPPALEPAPFDDFCSPPPALEPAPFDDFCSPPPALEPAPFDDFRSPPPALEPAPLPTTTFIGGGSPKYHQERELLRIFLNHYEKKLNVDGETVTVGTYFEEKVGGYVFENVLFERLKNILCDAVVAGTPPPLDELLSGTIDDPHAEALRNLTAELLTPPESLSENWRKHDVYLKEFDADLALTVIQSLHHYDLKYFNGLLKQNLDEFRAMSQEKELTDEQYDRMLKRHNKILETRKMIAEFLGVVITG